MEDTPQTPEIAAIILTHNFFGNIVDAPTNAIDTNPPPPMPCADIAAAGSREGWLHGSDGGQLRLGSDQAQRDAILRLPRLRLHGRDGAQPRQRRDRQPSERRRRL